MLLTPQIRDKDAGAAALLLAELALEQKRQGQQRAGLSRPHSPASSATTPTWPATW